MGEIGIIILPVIQADNIILFLVSECMLGFSPRVAMHECSFALLCVLLKQSVNVPAGNAQFSLCPVLVDSSLAQGLDYFILFLLVHSQLYFLQMLAPFYVRMKPKCNTTRDNISNNTMRLYHISITWLRTCVRKSLTGTAP